MSGLVVNEAACTGCGKCVRSCSSNGIEVVGQKPHRKARVTDSCVLCGICVGSCPFGALSIQKDRAAVVGANAQAGDGAETAGEVASGAETGSGDGSMADYRDIWVFAQVDDGVVAPVAFELLGRGRELADAKGCRLVAVLGEGVSATKASAANAGTSAAAGTGDKGAGRATVASEQRPDNAGQLIAAGADEVIVCRDARLAQLNAEVFAPWLAGLIAHRKPEAVLFGATTFGRELAPGIAARVRTGLTADCTVLAIDPATGLLQQTRPAFGGNLMATIVCPDHRPQMATVRPGVLPAATPDPARTGIVTEVALGELAPARATIHETLPATDADSITDAEVLVVVGRGLGSQKNLPLAQRLAKLLGAKLGCSRPLVEAGWLEYWHQVGQTGCSVAPKLLVSIGVSGAIQHLAGIGGAQTVIAINTDETAPIFGASQYTVTGDCIEIMKAWIALLETRA